MGRVQKFCALGSTSVQRRMDLGTSPLQVQLRTRLRSDLTDTPAQFRAQQSSERHAIGVPDGSCHILDAVGGRLQQADSMLQPKVLKETQRCLPGGRLDASRQGSGARMHAGCCDGQIKTLGQMGTRPPLESFSQAVRVRKMIRYDECSLRGTFLHQQIACRRRSQQGAAAIDKAQRQINMGQRGTRCDKRVGRDEHSRFFEAHILVPLPEMRRQPP